MIHSTGRGGLGNIRQQSASRDARPETGPDDFSATRGREPVPSKTGVFSTGRGGAGNLRSPSRDPRSSSNDAVAAEKEREVIRDYVQSHEGAAFSSGRGGLGNINPGSRSRSRDPTSATAAGEKVFSTGRGGAGNIVAGDGSIAEAYDEDERKHVPHTEGGLHSTGRGGGGNITHGAAPPVEPHHAAQHTQPQFESHGRGGAGNIAKSGH
ncbi:hypothetical protein D9619_012501 [Psilocybe cf. subviscida]|uniref:Uncharacterized protein n=1 Tax=Psilocybe cf. subviscida TaxID=2480587 RepID=A0A8H5B6S1_9AGAR|nr:hypothetical protein D9619_012501 [Psilocybe cf. subviscida]